MHSKEIICNNAFFITFQSGALIKLCRSPNSALSVTARATHNFTELPHACSSVLLCVSAVSPQSFPGLLGLVSSPLGFQCAFVETRTKQWASLKLPQCSGQGITPITLVQEMFVVWVFNKKRIIVVSIVSTFNDRNDNNLPAVCFK